ncbi:MAG TPA: hypothetical protein PK961_13990, partial [bacterium]|nr:hypothetical protein [bacterium]
MRDMKHFILFICLLLAFVGCVESNGLEEVPGEQTPPEALPATCASELVFAADGASFSLTSDECAIGLLDATARLAWRDTDGALHIVAAKDYPQRDVVETANGRQWSLSGHAQAPELSVAIAFDAEAGTAVLRPTVAWPPRLGEGARLVYLDLPSTGEKGAGVRLPANLGRAAWVQNGHDSWTFTGVENLLPDDPPPTKVDGAPATCAENYEYLSTCHGVSWWMGAVADAERGPGLLWGALAARHWKTYAGGSLTHADDLVRLQIVQGTPGDERALMPGGTLEMEPIWLKLAARPAYDQYEYAQAAAAETPPLEPERAAPFGWATWYEYFTEIDRDIVLDNC